MWCCAVKCTSSARRLPHPDFSWSADMNTFSAASLWEVPKRSLGEFCLVDSKRSPAGQPWVLRQFQGHWGTEPARVVADPCTGKHTAPAVCCTLVLHAGAARWCCTLVLHAGAPGHHILLQAAGAFRAAACCAACWCRQSWGFMLMLSKRLKLFRRRAASGCFGHRDSHSHAIAPERGFPSHMLDTAATAVECTECWPARLDIVGPWSTL